MSLAVPGGTITAGTGINITTGNIIATTGKITARSINLFNTGGTFKTIINPLSALAADNTLTLPTNTGTLSTITSLAASSTTGIQIAGGPVTTGSGTLTVNLPNSVPGRNRIINGNFQGWQRGTTFSTTVKYGPDRWQVGNSVGSWVVSQQPGPTSGSYKCRILRNFSTSDTTALGITTSLTRDMCIGMAGNIVTLSYTATAGPSFSASGSLIAVTIKTGTGTTDVSSVTTGFTGSTTLSTTQVISTTETRYSYTTVALGSTVTQISAGLSYTPSGTAGFGDYFDVSNIQLEISPTATSFEYMNYCNTIRACEYFFQTTAAGIGYGAGTGGQFCISTRTYMRTIPTILTTGALVVTDGAANYTQSSGHISQSLFANGSGCLIGLDNYTFGGVTRSMIFNFSVNGNYITMDSELT
jgi:hypothetical protein